MVNANEFTAYISELLLKIDETKKMGSKNSQNSRQTRNEERLLHFILYLYLGMNYYVLFLFSC